MKKLKPRVFVRKAFMGGWEPVLNIGVQYFSIDCGPKASKRRAQWFAKSLRKALKQVSP